MGFFFFTKKSKKIKTRRTVTSKPKLLIVLFALMVFSGLKKVSQRDVKTLCFVLQSGSDCPQ